jgi:hypothetical protein
MSNPNTTEFITCQELLSRVTAWENAPVGRTFLRDLGAGHRAVGNGYTAWQGFNGFWWATA